MIGKQINTILLSDKDIKVSEKDHNQQNIIQESQASQVLQVTNQKNDLSLSKYGMMQKQELQKKRQLFVVYLMYKEQTLSLFIEKGTSLENLTKMMYKQIHNYEKKTHSLSTVILKNCLNRITGFQTIDKDLIWDYHLKINSGNISQQKFFKIFTHDNLRMPFKIYAEIQSDLQFQGTQFLIRNFSDGKWGILTSISKSSLAEDKLNGLKKSLRINFNSAALLIKGSYNEVSQLNWIQTKNRLYITTQFIPETLQKYLSKGIKKGEIYKIIKYWARLYSQISKLITNNYFHVFKKLTISSFTFESQTKQLRLNVFANSLSCLNAFQKRNGSKNTFDIGKKKTVLFESIKNIDSKKNLDVKRKLTFKKDQKQNKKDFKQKKKDLKQHQFSQDSKKSIKSIKSNKNNDLKSNSVQKKYIISEQSLEDKQNRKSSSSNVTNGPKIIKKYTNVFYHKAFQNLIKQLKGFLLMNQQTYLKDQTFFIQWVLDQILNQSFQFFNFIKKLDDIWPIQNKNYSFDINCEQKFFKIAGSLKTQNKNSNFMQSKNSHLIQNANKEIDKFFKNQHLRRCKQNQKTAKVIDLLEKKLFVTSQNVGNIVQFQKQQKRKSILSTKEKLFIKSILNQFSDTQKFVVTTKQNNLASIQNYMLKSNFHTKNQMVSKIKSKYQKFFQKTKITCNKLKKQLLQKYDQQNLLKQKQLTKANPKISLQSNFMSEKKDKNQSNFSFTNRQNHKNNFNLNIKTRKTDYQRNSERITHSQLSKQNKISPKFSYLINQKRFQISQRSWQKNKTQHQTNYLSKNSFYTNRPILNQSINESLINKDDNIFNKNKYRIYLIEAEKYFKKVQQYRQKIKPNNKNKLEQKIKPSKFQKLKS